MNRRGFLAATAALLITPTLTSKAQQAGKVPRVGFLYQLYRSETNGEPLAQRATTTIQGCGWLEKYARPLGQTVPVRHYAAQASRSNIGIFINQKDN
jgi:hypothetical protein